MGVYDGLLRKLLFRMDPEKAHNLALWFISRGLVRGGRFADQRLAQELFGVRFPNPLGLAAGFDKNAVALSHWDRLGFGFVEVGTVTYHPQPGNPKPRLFRLPTDQALINRMGFNNDGAERIASRIRRTKPQIPVGINIGKSKIAPIEQAAEDYAASYLLLHDLGDYFVINVSSPNTPGLRDLQEPARLHEIVSALQEIDATRPLFVKISPDLSTEGMDDIVSLAHERKLAGIVATNTTLARETLATDGSPQQRDLRRHATIDEEGGLSGAPLRDRSNEVLRRLHATCDKSMTLIGVGGILTGNDVYEKIHCGAHLCQSYTGFVYGGPSFASRSLSQLASRLQADRQTIAGLRTTINTSTP